MSDANDVEVTIEERGSGGVYRALVDGHPAEMTFSRVSPKLIIIDHTDVPDALRGRGIGQILVKRAVDEARSVGGKIIPLCPFAAAQFRRYADYSDVLSR